MKASPLVSICIPNFNYARYLPACFDSLLHQNCRNFEVIFRDNASSDESYPIAESYQSRFAEKNIPYTINRNPYNYGSDRNSNLCAEAAKGKYLLILASDDILYPYYLEKTVGILEKYPQVSMVMTHRDEIDSEGIISHIPSFYDRSCIVPGEEQAAVFMMAGIAIPGQRIMRVEALKKIRQWVCTFQVANDWYFNALLSCVGDIAYLKEPHMQYRVHGENETSESEKNLTAVLEHYQIIHKIAKVTQEYGYVKPAERLPEAIEKLGKMCLRYTYKMLQNDLDDVAAQYLALAKVFQKDIEQNTYYQKLQAILKLSKSERRQAIQAASTDMLVSRRISYDPPEGYTDLD